MNELNAFELTNSDTRSSYVTVDLKETKSFNTITLEEKGKNITLFSIYGSNSLDQGYEVIYQSDTIENAKVCYVGDVSYRYLRISVIEPQSGEFELNGIGVYNLKSDRAQDLRVTAYAVVDSITPETDFSMLDGVTDIIFFGMAYLTEEGEIIFKADDEHEVDVCVYEEKLNILKNAIGDRNINIVVDIHVPYGDDNSMIDSMMTEHLDNTVANIKAFVDKYGFSGYDIDYEYPSSDEEWTHYNDFLRELDQAMPDKIISIATASWALPFDADVLELIDRVELMLYDGFDGHGYHSTFPYTANGVQQLLDTGMPKSKIDIGVPFYSRPTNEIAFWGNYTDYPEQIGRYNNLVYDNTLDHSVLPLTAPQYFNSPQMIADKTAFAIDAGLGGIMIWHMTCDMPYDSESSLTRAINETKAEKALA